MNKKLIATAMGLAMAGGMGLANADVKLYGQIDLSLVATDSDAPGFEDDINMKSTNSNIGVKGEEDLGNGMSAFFKLEYETDVANASGLSGRDQYVGLGMENFGKLTFGTTSTAYKSPSKQIDFMYMTQLQSRQIGLQSNLHSGKGEEGQGRGTNMVRYDSPSLSGFTLNGTYQFDSSKGDGEDDDPYSVGLTYKGGNFFANASYIDTQRDDDGAAAEFLVRYDWNDLSVHGIYELDKGLITAQRDNGLGTSFSRKGSAQDDGADIYSVGATYTIGNNLIGADWGHGDDSDGVDGVAGTGDDLEEYDVWRIGAWHSFSKRTRVYAGYANTDYNDKGEDDTFALGLRHNF
jgi:predicted porin